MTDARGRPVAARGLGAWLARAAPRSARGSVSIALVSDATMRRLNERYRGVARTTDVLSFPAWGSELASARHGPILGDIAIAVGTARRQARAQGHAPATELRLLALHGLLHLLGYDHTSDRGEMRRLESRLVRRAGLSVGLTGRRAPR